MQSYCGGPASSRRLLVAWRPDGLTQLTVIVSPGRSLASIAVRLSGDAVGLPFTAVITDPPVIPAAAAGLPQMVPSTSVPEETGAIDDGTARSALLV